MQAMCSANVHGSLRTKEKIGTNLACSDMQRGSKAEAGMVQVWILDD
jgi:hypothetical protein